MRPRKILRCGEEIVRSKSHTVVGRLPEAVARDHEIHRMDQVRCVASHALAFAQSVAD
jgi:hypothetical protein